MTSIAVAPEIVGKALYLELVNNPALTSDELDSVMRWQKNAVKQVIMFPEYADSVSGNTSSSFVMSRTVSTYQPKAQWEINELRNRPKPRAEWEESAKSGYHTGYVNVPTYSREEWDLLPSVARLESQALAVELWLRGQLLSTMSKEVNGEAVIVAKQAWAVRDDKPFSVEITNEDMETIKSHRTPQAVIRRINKVRESLAKFPAKLA
jgi:hypothetical protein